MCVGLRRTVVRLFEAAASQRRQLPQSVSRRRANAIDAVGPIIDNPHRRVGLGSEERAYSVTDWSVTKLPRLILRCRSAESAHMQRRIGARMDATLLVLKATRN